MKFTYSSGATPLEGYTIKRGIGHGGFGEVYYALSDGGKEVALKLVRNNLDVELRGMAQCLNLKHPNLVALFDIKEDKQGDSWVIMEYMGGESLTDELARHPDGMPKETIASRFTGIAKAIGYLHDNGIVHRDLKPGNIFVENDTIKIGDYGLSKFITSSQRSAQTQSVGTVHYMAPEVSTGKYGKSIDLYAAGIILYEMLTGEVPFAGESAGEILMKHLTATPDLTKLPGDYAPIVGKALAKDPNHRYSSFEEMTRAVQRIGGKQAPFVKAAAVPPPLPRPKVVKPPEPPAPPPTLGERVGSLSGSMALAGVLSVLAAMLWTVANEQGGFTWTGSPADLSSTFLATLCLIAGASWAVMLPAKFWEEHRGDQWRRRGIMLLAGLGVGVFAYWLDGGIIDGRHLNASDQTVGLSPIMASAVGWEDGFPARLVQYMCFYGLAFFLLRWWKLADPKRPRRIALFPIFLTGFGSWLLYALIWQQEGVSDAVIALAGTAAVVQIVSPWREPPPRPLKKVRLRYA